MKELMQTIDSREVAEMLEKEHKKLLRDIRRYITQLGEAKIGPTDFFIESSYKTGQNKTMPSYKITKMGCEFLAHKLTGIKGTAFTARYIKRFHQMEEALRDRGEAKVEAVRLLPKFQGYFVEEKQIAAKFIQDYITQNNDDTGLYNAYALWCIDNKMIYLTRSMFYYVKKKVIRLRLETGSWIPYINAARMLKG